ncbi:alpha/beta hydrolase [Agromyces badenianii]|uniref:Alpha/beta hydrolase n=1 Tax=Agromyces badenianii TaxID=2080742 RepID=A0A2S0X043_9MICO|nr:alpha/beta hydrolase [Agromyces badenianii]AWB96963.1 alpha/beta hydrolase [Agromyces badenianii]
MVFRVLATAAEDASEPCTYVLVHGVGVSHRSLARLHEELARTADVFSIDLPGFGGLPKPHGDVDVAGMAAALGDVLDLLGLTNVVLVGHSMGTQWVVELAAARPQLAKGVVIIGPVTDSRHRSLAAQLIALAVDTVGEPPNVNRVVFADYLRCGPRWYLRQTRHMVEYRLDRRVEDLAMPLLVVRGGNDPIAGTEWCRRLRDHAPHGSLVIVPRNRHVVQYTAPRAVAAAVRAWLTEHSKQQHSPIPAT